MSQSLGNTKANVFEPYPRKRSRPAVDPNLIVDLLLNEKRQATGELYSSDGPPFGMDSD